MWSLDADVKCVVVPPDFATRSDVVGIRPVHHREVGGEASGDDVFTTTEELELLALGSVGRDSNHDLHDSGAAALTGCWLAGGKVDEVAQQGQPNQ